MHLVDVHAHLDHPDFAADLPRVIENAKRLGIVAVIAQGVSHESNMGLLKLAKIDPLIKIAFGLYPTFASNSPDVLPEAEKNEKSNTSVEETLSAIKKHKDDIIAIGEVGLEFKHSDDRLIQVETFRKIVRLAKELQKPLIIHSRGAEKEVMDVLEEEKYFHADLHCFCGNKKLIERGIKLGLIFSIPANVVRNQQFQQMVEILPIGHILTETDAPYLGLVKDVRNEPANVREAVLKIAELKRMDPIECANAIYYNYQKLFL